MITIQKAGAQRLFNHPVVSFRLCQRSDTRLGTMLRSTDFIIKKLTRVHIWAVLTVAYLYSFPLRTWKLKYKREYLLTVLRGHKTRYLTREI